MNDTIYQCVEQIRKKTSFIPKVAIVLGSGLGEYANQMDIVDVVSYSEIEGFKQSTVEGHEGCLIFGYIEKVPVVMMKGRIHYYEGYEMTDVVMPIRVMGLLGAKLLLLTNAAGGINDSFNPGDLMMITDQITTFVPSPLRGANSGEIGPRFPDMSCVYDKELSNYLVKASKEIGLTIKQGVYLQTSGPNYETPAEIKMFKLLGADAVGMSTACEAMAARHMGLRVCGISCITNMAAGISNTVLSHEEVQETANQVKIQFEHLVTRWIVNIKDLI